MGGLLSGKIALVTGAGKNIGRAIALTLARDGATVVVNGRSDAAAIEAVAEEIRAMGGQARAELADVSDPAAVERMVGSIQDSLGGIDVLVSNAGLRRKASVQEIADVVRMLAGPEGGYVTGQTIHVNGGSFLG